LQNERDEKARDQAFLLEQKRREAEYRQARVDAQERALFRERVEQRRQALEFNASGSSCGAPDGERKASAEESARYD